MSEPIPTTTGLTLEALQRMREAMRVNVTSPVETGWLYTNPLFFDHDPGRTITVSASTGERDLARGGRQEGEGALRGIVYPSCFKRRGSTHYTGLNRKQRRAIFRNPWAVPYPYGSTLVSGRPGELGEEREVVSPASEAGSFRAGLSLPGVHGNYATIINASNQH